MKESFTTTKCMGLADSFWTQETSTREIFAMENLMDLDLICISQINRFIRGTLKMMFRMGKAKRFGLMEPFTKEGL